MTIKTLPLRCEMDRLKSSTLGVRMREPKHTSCTHLTLNAGTERPPAIQIYSRKVNQPLSTVMQS